MSVTAWEVVWLALVWSSVSLAHQTEGAETTPGRTRSVMTASAGNAPRSVKSGTRAPPRRTRGAARPGGARAGVVERPSPRPRGDAARECVVGVDLQGRLAGSAAQRGDVDEARV